MLYNNKKKDYFMFKYLYLYLFFSFTVYADNGLSFTDTFGSLMIFPFLFILMYFLLIRPQSKKIKEHKILLETININDEVVLQSGIVGKVKKIFDKFILLSVNEDNDILIKKESIASLIPKGTLKQFKC